MGRPLSHRRAIRDGDGLSARLSRQHAWPCAIATRLSSRSSCPLRRICSDHRQRQTPEIRRRPTRVSFARARCAASRHALSCCSTLSAIISDASLCNMSQRWRKSRGYRTSQRIDGVWRTTSNLSLWTRQQNITYRQITCLVPWMRNSSVKKPRLRLTPKHRRPQPSRYWSRV